MPKLERIFLTSIDENLCTIAFGHLASEYLILLKKSDICTSIIYHRYQVKFGNDGKEPICYFELSSFKIIDTNDFDPVSSLNPEIVNLC